MLNSLSIYYLLDKLSQVTRRVVSPLGKDNPKRFLNKVAGAPNGNFRENICSEDDLRTRIFGTFVVKFLACLPLLGFSNIYKMV